MNERNAANNEGDERAKRLQRPIRLYQEGYLRGVFLLCTSGFDQTVNFVERHTFLFRIKFFLLIIYHSIVPINTYFLPINSFKNLMSPSSRFSSSRPPHINIERLPLLDSNKRAPRVWWNRVRNMLAHFTGLCYCHHCHIIQPSSDTR